MGTTHRDRRGRCAIFLDRDGVINRNVLNPATGQYESPQAADDFALLPDAPSALTQLRDAGFLLFLVSNQPNYAKGKSTLAELEAIDAVFRREMSQINVEFAAVYYCLHHPKGRVPGYSGPCVCRKPSPYFLLNAIRKFNLDASQCWMIGDRATDILCGHSAGVRTILIGETVQNNTFLADHTAPNLAAASEHICANAAVHALLQVQVPRFGACGDGHSQSIRD